jgi:hypothetical protein
MFWNLAHSMNSKNRGSPTRPLLSFSQHDRIHLYKADDPLADSVSTLFVVGSVLPAPISLGALRLDVSSQLRPLKIRADKLRQEALKGRLVGKTVEWMMGRAKQVQAPGAVSGMGNGRGGALHR